MDEGGLLTWAKREFEESIDTLHMKYFRCGTYPKGDLEWEFYRWFGRVREYIDKLAAETLLERSAEPDRGASNMHAKYHRQNKYTR